MKRLGLTVVKLTGVMLVVMCAALFAAAPSSMNMQGVLRTAGGTPVPDGSYPTTFSLWTDVSGGTQVWTETQPVTTSGGLFTVELGHVASLDGVFASNTDGTLYLETSFLISGMPVVMTPRTPMLSVPYSSSAAAVHGLHQGGSTTATIRMQATSDSVFTNEQFAVAVGGPTFTATGVFSDGGGERKMGTDLNADGLVDLFNAQVVTEDSVTNELVCASLLLPALTKVKEKANKTKCSSSLRYGSSGTTDSTGTDLSCDVDGVHSTWTGHHGSTTGTIRMHATPDSVTEWRDMDSDGDGVPESDSRLVVTPGTCAVAIKTRGTGADKNRVASGTDQDSAYTVVDHDSDDDGLSESECRTLVTESSSRVAIKTKGTGAANNRCAMGTSPDSGVIVVDHDDDNDGVPEASITQTITPTTSHLAIKTKGTSAQRSSSSIECDDDDDGIPESECLTIVTPGTSSVAINTKGTGADKGRCAIGVDQDSAYSVVDHDSDGDNVPECGTGVYVKPVRVQLARYFQTGDIPNQQDRIIIDSVDASGTSTTMTSLAPGLPPGEPVIGTLRLATTTSSSSIAIGDVDGDGLADLSVSGGGKNVGLYVSSVTGQCAMLMTDASSGTPETTIVLDGHSKRFGIGVSDPAHPLEHSSGAHLTVGGDWINASSRSLKENFTTVDGEEILEKVEELPITEWNYKAEDASITHIGPTAEDFHKAFGIGESDKAISTIDPSGIALAAIKELSKQNKQLKKQNDELQKQLGDLQKAVEKLMKQNEKGQ